MGAYLSWLVRGLMLLTGIITWPIGKLLDWCAGVLVWMCGRGAAGVAAEPAAWPALSQRQRGRRPGRPRPARLPRVLGEESALFRRHELKALVNIHAEPQDSGRGGEEMAAVLTLDEVQVRRLRRRPARCLLRLSLICTHTCASSDQYPAALPSCPRR